jgi:hypothetical protein
MKPASPAKVVKTAGEALRNFCVNELAMKSRVAWRRKPIITVPEYDTWMTILAQVSRRREFKAALTRCKLQMLLLAYPVQIASRSRLMDVCA